MPSFWYHSPMKKQTKQRRNPWRRVDSRAVARKYEMSLGHPVVAIKEEVLQKDGARSESTGANWKESEWSKLEQSELQSK